MKKAIVLGGGGSRGAYQAGVWSALRDEDMTFDIITGTSIGALNGALMAQDDYSAALSIWENISVDQIIKDGINLDISIPFMLEQKEKLGPFFKQYLTNNGADITPLRKLIEKTIDEDKVRSSQVEYGLVAMQFPSLKPMELSKDQIPAGQLHDWLMASAACFPAFPMMKIDGKSYVDGGFYDILPVDFALRLGAEDILAVDLEFSPSHPEYQNRPFITYVKPSWNLGSILLFENEIIRKNMLLGYYDAKKTFGKYIGFRYVFDKASISERHLAAAKKLSLMIGAIEADLDESKPQMLRIGRFPMTSEICEHTSGKRLTYLDYLIRSLEIGAEILEMDHLKVYKLQDMVDEIADKISELDMQNGDRSSSITTGNRHAKEFMAALNLVERKEVLCSIYKSIKEAKDVQKEAKNIAEAYPKILAGALGIFMI